MLVIDKVSCLRGDILKIQLSLTECKDIDVSLCWFRQEDCKKICYLIFWGILVERLNTSEVEVSCKPNSGITSHWTKEVMNGYNSKPNKGGSQLMICELYS